MLRLISERRFLFRK